MLLQGDPQCHACPRRSARMCSWTLTPSRRRSPAWAQQLSLSWTSPQTSSTPLRGCPTSTSTSPADSVHPAGALLFAHLALHTMPLAVLPCSKLRLMEVHTCHAYTAYHLRRSFTCGLVQSEGCWLQRSCSMTVQDHVCMEKGAWLACQSLFLLCSSLTS